MNDCIICRKQNFVPIYSGTLKKCSACGFITANLEVSSELLRETYKISYFQGEEYLDYLRDKQILQLNFEKRMDWIRRESQQGLPVNNCLEIGCAYGFFGEVFLKYFPVTYSGVDIVPEAIHYGRDQLGLDLITGDYLEMQAPAKLYSDIFLWDVIEHLQHPERFIQKASRELMSGGRIYISTGDIGALLPRLQGRKWRMIHPPSHLHYFNKYTLKRLLENSGFKVIKTSYMPTYRSLRQIYYSLFLLKKFRKIPARLFKLIPVRWYIPINTYDIVFMTATKV